MTQADLLDELIDKLTPDVDDTGVWDVIQERVQTGRAQKRQWVSERRQASTAEAEARAGGEAARAPGRLGKPSLRVAVYASIAAVVVAAIAVGSIVGVGRLGHQRFALVIPAEAHAGTGAQSGQWQRLLVPTSEGVPVGDLVLDPSNPSVLYALGGGGLFKTSDGAGSWKKLSTTMGNVSHVWVVAVDPASPSTVYAYVSYAPDDRSPLDRHRHMLRSDDGGATWTDLGRADVFGAWAPYRMWFDTAFSPSRVYTWSVDGGTWVSTDRGETWTKLGPEEADKAGRKRPSASAAAQRVAETIGVFPGFVETIALTDADTGFVLHVQADPGPCIASGDPSTFYLGTGEGVYKSTDGGKTWRKASAGMVSSEVWDVIPDPSSPSTLYAAASAGIFKTTDGGATWNMILAGGAGSIVMAPSSPSTLYAWTSAGLFRTDNGGADWTRRAALGLVTSYDVNGIAVQRAVGGLILVAADNPDTVLATMADDDGSGPQVRLVRSIDGGNTWSRVLEGLEQWGPVDRFGPVVGADPLNPSTLFATVGTQSATPGESVFHVVKSTDAGATWMVVSPEQWVDPASSTDVGMATDSSTPSNAYLVQSTDTGRKRVYRSLDGGTTWEEVEVGGLANDICQLLFDPRSPDTMYVRTHDTGQTGIYRSTDRGATWQNITGELSDRHDLNIMIDPAPGGGLYAITGTDLFSTDLFRWVPGGDQ